jgi:glycosyltransferase involved in cell wall biosynthesis
MWKGKSVWVVMPAYNEAEGIANTVKGFYKIPQVDKVLVVNNNSRDQTAKLAHDAGAIVVTEKKQGYGYACMTALKESKGYYTVLVEADNSFFPEDMDKFFAFIDQFDMVKGGRSNDHMIDKGADWTWFLKWGNWFLAKMIQALYPGDSSMREAGGTYRMVKRPCLNAILPHLSRGDNAFLPDMVTITLRKGFTVLELPLRYRNRQGTSKITGSRWTAFKLGFSMINVILTNRIKRLNHKNVSKKRNK